MVAKKLEEKLDRVENLRKNRYYPDFSIAEIVQKIQKCPGDLKKFPVIHTSVKSLYEKSYDVIKFIEKNMNNWRGELIAGGESFAEGKLQVYLFQRDAISSLLSVIQMIPINYILKRCTGGYKIHKKQEKIDHLMYMDHIKLFAKNEKYLKTLIQAVKIYSEDIGIKLGKNGLC